MSRVRFSNAAFSSGVLFGFAIRLEQVDDSLHGGSDIRKEQYCKPHVLLVDRGLTRSTPQHDAILR